MAKASKRKDNEQATPRPPKEKHWTSVNARFQNTQSFKRQTKPKQEVCDKLSKHAHTNAGVAHHSEKMKTSTWWVGE